MNADTESNVDTARSRAERLIEQGAHVLVGAVRLRAHRPRSRRWPSSAACPSSSTSRPRRRSPSRATSSCSGTFRPRPRSAATAWCCWATSSARRRSSRRPRCSCTSTTPSASRWPRASAALLPKVSLPFKLLDTIPYDPAAKDLNVEVSKAKATNAELLLLVCRLNDAIVLRREMVKQRWSPMGVVEPRIAGPLRGAVQQGRSGSTPTTASRTRSGSTPRTRSRTRSRRRSRSGSPRTSSRFTASTPATRSTPS